MLKRHFTAPGAAYTHPWPSPATAAGQGILHCLPSLFTVAANTWLGGHWNRLGLSWCRISPHLWNWTIVPYNADLGQL